MSRIIHYDLEHKTAYDKFYISVYLKNQNDLDKIKTLLESCSCVYKVTESFSKSNKHPGPFLNVHPKLMVTKDELEKVIKKLLNEFFLGIIVVDNDIENEAHFKGIENKILNTLDQAKATIDVCVAWFTNEQIKSKLLQKQQEGIAVRVIVYDDGVNKRSGVDLSQIPTRRLRAPKKGIYHHKFCVVDNYILIMGSYNWTNNAELRNAENINITKGDVKVCSEYTRYFNSEWKRDI